MRLPIRKSETLRRSMLDPEDHHLTPQAIKRMRDELDDLLKRQRPEMIQEVRRLAEMGDFSENAGYQIAKGTLRRINDRIVTLQERIKTAIPIEKNPGGEGKIRLGSTVVVDVGGKTWTFEIVGSQETNPARGRISHHSPLGQALLGRGVDEIIAVKAGEKDLAYRILEIK